MGARVMIQWLRVLLVLVEDPSSMPCTHVVAHNYPLLWSREYNVLFELSSHKAHMVHIHASKTPSHIK